MDFGKVISSPTVIIAGVVIGGAILLFNSSATASGSSSNSAYTSGTAANNAALLTASTQQSQIAANVAMNQSNNDVAKTNSYLSFWANANNNASQVTLGLNAANAGIINNQITTNAAVTIDASNNSNRLDLAYVSANTSAIQANYQYLGTVAQGNASVAISANQAAAAAAQASASKSNGIFGALGSIGAASALAFL